ncbi:MAG TPA: PQQ-binding-like beta-propeller repeat protein [Gammaproteobacteria bacterium]|jgi:outer membrane protein assembly factor BamB|nr:PQQ-binding-like beta-propeller repeat protein [Gammaproteobacteria bacterium]
MRAAIVLCLLTLSLSAVRADTPPADPLLGTWTGQVHDGAAMRPFGLRFTAGKSGTPDLAWTLPEANLKDYGPIPMVLHDGWYHEASQDHYDLQFRLADDHEHVTGVLAFDGHTLPFDLVRGPLPALAERDMGGKAATPLWSFKTGGAIWSTPAYAEGAVYFGSNDGKVYALDAAGGKLKWSAATGGPVLSPVSLDGGWLYALSDDGFLYKLARKDGKRAWRFDTHGGAVKRQGYDRLASGAVRVADTLFVGSADGALYAIDPATGKERWHYLTQGMVRSTPAVADGRVYFGSYDHAIYALDAKSGARLWRRDTLMPVVSTPLVADGRVFIGSRNADLYALDARTGETVWRKFYWVSWVESSATLADGTLYVGSSDCLQFYALDPATGEERWRFGAGGEAWSTPAVDAGRVYVGSVGYAGYGRFGGFYGLDRASGRPLWRFDLPPGGGDQGFGVGGSPALGAGKVYFGTLEGLFYAFPIAG